MDIRQINGAANYTLEIITELRHMFGDGLIESRPITLNGNVMWLDAEQLLHREGGLPAVEKSNGEVQYWVHGEKRVK